ncbi:DUF4190 domain-containing protein [archaeon]|jgi:FlaA1/EpsC-like NDP-sugar epimerase|nr:DUF4190 domain-containing protein [archaeon]
MKSKLAITSLILSLIAPVIFASSYLFFFLDVRADNILFTSFIISPFLAILTIILSKISFTSIKQRKLEGKKYAIAGLIIGSLTLLIWLIFLFSMKSF